MRQGKPLFRKLGRFGEEQNDIGDSIEQTMIRLFRMACIFQYSAAFAGTTRPRQREREQERGKKGNKDLFSLTYQSGARLVSQKSIFAR